MNDQAILALVKTVAALVLFSSGGWLVCRLLARRSAVRHFLALSVLSACLLLPVLSFLTYRTNMTLVPITLPGAKPDAAILDLQEQQVLEPVGADITTIEAVPITAARTEQPVPWHLIAGLAYGLGALLGLGRLAMGAAKLVKTIRSSRELDPVFGDQWALAHVDVESPTPFKGIRQSERVWAPMAVGPVRPMLIVPETVSEETDPTALRQIFAHEAAHVEGKHLWGGLLSRIATTVLWPVPFVHLVSRELSRAQEEICDEAALQVGAPTAYARLLLSLTQGDQAPGVIGLSCGFLDSNFPLKARIRGILDPSKRKHTTMKRTTKAALVCGVSTTLILLAGTQVVLAQEAPTEAKTATTSTVAPPSGIANVAPPLPQETAIFPTSEVLPPLEPRQDKGVLRQQIRLEKLRLKRERLGMRNRGLQRGRAVSGPILEPPRTVDLPLAGRPPLGERIVAPSEEGVKSTGTPRLGRATTSPFKVTTLKPGQQRFTTTVDPSGLAEVPVTPYSSLKAQPSTLSYRILARPKEIDGPVPGQVGTTPLPFSTSVRGQLGGTTAASPFTTSQKQIRDGALGGARRIGTATTRSANPLGGGVTIQEGAAVAMPRQNDPVRAGRSATTVRDSVVARGSAAPIAISRGVLAPGSAVDSAVVISSAPRKAKTPKAVIKQATVVIYDDGSTQIIGGTVEKPKAKVTVRKPAAKKTTPVKRKAK